MKAFLSLLSALIFVATSAPEPTPEAAYETHLPLVLKTYALNACQAPALIEPADGSSLTSIAPVFRWDRGAGSLATSLTIQVSLDPTFATSTGSYTTTSAHWVDEFRFPKNFAEGSTYYWRAYVVCGSSDPVYTAAWSFATPGSVALLSAPVLTAPADLSTLAGTSTTLQWEAVSGAVDYLVKWQKVGTTSTSSKFVPASQLQYSLAGLSSATDYEWWVSAVNADAIGEEPAHWRFSTP